MLQVRLTTFEIDSIIRVFKSVFSSDDKLWLFGSRVDITQKGGDIDLYVQTHIADSKSALACKKFFLSELKKTIGDQKIDLVLDLGNKELEIYKIAQAEGVELV